MTLTVPWQWLYKQNERANGSTPPNGARIVVSTYAVVGGGRLMVPVRVVECYAVFLVDCAFNMFTS